MNELTFDLETEGLSPIEDAPVGVGFDWNGSGAEYNQTLGTINYADAEILIGHNLKFDMQFLRTNGCSWGKNVKLFDTLIAEWMLHPDQGKYDLKWLTKKYFDITYTTFDELLNKYKEKGVKKKDTTIQVVPQIEVEKYCKMDVDMTRKLYDLLKPQIVQSGMWDLFCMEMDFLKVLIEVELNGVFVSRNSLSELNLKFDEMMKEQVKFMPEGINISSPQQLSSYLFEELGLPTEGIKSSNRILKGGEKKLFYKTDDEALSILDGKHEVIAHIKEYRNIEKLQGTYSNALIKHIHKDGKIHTSFNQHGTSTGRLSSAKPNLQNIPTLDEIRGVFIPTENNVLLSADYNQAELWIIAHLGNDKNMTNDLLEGKDIYVEIAKAMFLSEDITEDMRSEAKVIVLGINYGRTKWSLAKELHIEDDEAQRRINAYFRKYPGVSRFIKFSPILAEKQGYSSTLLDRRRPYQPMMDKFQSKNQVARRCINTPIQGTCADFIKLAMIKMQNSIDLFKLKSKLILQVHDEVVLDVVPEELETIKTIVKLSMDVCKDYGIPIPIEVKIGEDWGSLEEVK